MAAAAGLFGVQKNYNRGCFRVSRGRLYVMARLDPTRFTHLEFLFVFNILRPALRYGLVPVPAAFLLATSWESVGVSC